MHIRANSIVILKRWHRYSIATYYRVEYKLIRMDNDKYWQAHYMEYFNSLNQVKNNIIKSKIPLFLGVTQTNKNCVWDVVDTGNILKFYYEDLHTFFYRWGSIPTLKIRSEK